MTVINTYDNGTAGRRPEVDWAGTGYCQECGHGRVLLYPAAGFSGRHGSRRERWICGSCLARMGGHYHNAIIDRAPLNIRRDRGQRGSRARDGRPYLVVG